ncbi:MAG: fumarate hydratase [Lentisphaeria bacterium]|jgi:fumarate hydratase class I
MNWEAALQELITRASAELPADVAAALRAGRDREEPGSPAHAALSSLLDNIRLAQARRAPLCQDTGALLFFVEATPGLPQAPFRRAAEAAIRQATAAGILRPNSVDAITGRNSGDNLGPGAPVIHWREDEAIRHVTVSLLLKGGGSENMGAQFSLPDDALGASRDLEGVRRCLLHAVQRAQGMGCAPGILGVCIGGDRATGFAESKRQLLRPLGVRSPHPELAALEERVVREANTLGIGPMGVGGRTTLLGVAIGALNRLPASYFVSVSYLCWAARRQTGRYRPDGTPLP